MVFRKSVDRGLTQHGLGIYVSVVTDIFNRMLDHFDMIEQSGSFFCVNYPGILYFMPVNTLSIVAG